MPNINIPKKVGLCHRQGIVLIPEHSVEVIRHTHQLTHHGRDATLQMDVVLYGWPRYAEDDSENNTIMHTMCQK